MFRIVVSRLEDLFWRADQTSTGGETPSICGDDYKECNYLLETIYNVVSALSHNGWVALMTETLSPVDRHHETSASEGMFSSASCPLCSYAYDAL